MSPNTSTEAIIAHRRRLVAGMRLRHVTLREIVDALARSGEQNPATGKPWSLFAVHADSKALDAEWRAEAAKDTDTHKSAMLAELREVRRKAWAEGSLAIVLRSLQQEAQLLGLDEPAKIDIGVYVRRMAEEMGLDPDEAMREAERVLREARAR